MRVRLAVLLRRLANWLDPLPVAVKPPTIYLQSKPSRSA